MEMLNSVNLSKAQFLINSQPIPLDIERIDGQISMFCPLPYAIMVPATMAVDLSKPGKIFADGKKVSASFNCLKLPMAPVPLLVFSARSFATEYNKTYQVRLEGFKALDGQEFPTAVFFVKTEARRKDLKEEKDRWKDKAACLIASEGMVLLRNENRTLPLKSETKLAIFGGAQYEYRFSETGAGSVNPRYVDSVFDGLRLHSSFSYVEKLSAFYADRSFKMPSEALFKKAQAEAGAALIFLTRRTGENIDNLPAKGEYYLTDEEDSLIEKVSSSFKKTVVIINSGYPIDVRWAAKYHVGAVIYTSFAGMKGSFALMEILDGRVNPSGKTADSWPIDYPSSSAASSFLTGDELNRIEYAADKHKMGAKYYYEEGFYVGYRYYDTFQVPVSYPFGFGLSYTSFDIKAGKLSFDCEKASIQVEVENTGKFSGKEVVQIYLQAPQGKIKKAAHVLVGFQKTSLLKPGAKESLQISWPNSRFASFDATKEAYVIEKGEYQVFLGRSVANLTLVGTFSVAKEITVRKCLKVAAPKEIIEELAPGVPFKQGMRSCFVKADDRYGVKAKREYFKMVGFKKPERFIPFEDLFANSNLLAGFIGQMTAEELCHLVIAGGANYGPGKDGTAGRTAPLDKYHLPSAVFSDGDAGVNIAKGTTCLPCSDLVCCTWNPKMAYLAGKVIAADSKENRINMNIGVGMNIHRSVLNGRFPEYFSEDPFLAGSMAGNQAKGIQDQGIGACYKHLFCNNNDLLRQTSQSIVSEQALREIYFKVFEEALLVEKSKSLMTSYNLLNGIYVAESGNIIQDLIRKEWRYEGLIMTDWDTFETVEISKMVMAGNNLITPGKPGQQEQLLKDYQAGKLPLGVLQHNAYYIVKAVLETLI